MNKVTEWFWDRTMRYASIESVEQNDRLGKNIRTWWVCVVKEKSSINWRIAGSYEMYGTRSCLSARRREDVADDCHIFLIQNIVFPGHPIEFSHFD